MVERHMTLLLFVHGLGGNAKDTWGNFPNLIKGDKFLSELVDIGFYEYPTTLLRIPFLTKKAVNIQTLANGLKTQIENEFGEYQSIILVCHSLGGLIARRYIIDAIKRGSESKCRHLLLYAVPNNGAGLASVAKYVSWKHDQIRQLCLNTDFIEDMNEDWFSLKAPELITTKYVVAAQDRVVSSQSAKNFWGNPDVETAIQKGHRNIVKPKDNKDLVFLILKNFVKRTIKSINKIHIDYCASSPDAFARALFLAADAGVGLMLRKELEDIKIAVSGAPRELEIVGQFDVVASDFFVTLNKYNPEILHFSGNMADNALLLRSEQGDIEAIPEESLVNVLKLFSGRIRVVVLNTCNSYHCARAITEGVDCAIGVDGDISDTSAIVFAQAFYRAICFGISVEDAFQQGVAAIGFRDRDSTAACQGESQPKLVCKKGVDASKVFFSLPLKDTTECGRA